MIILPLPEHWRPRLKHRCIRFPGRVKHEAAAGEVIVHGGEKLVSELYNIGEIDIIEPDVAQANVLG